MKSIDSQRLKNREIKVCPVILNTINNEPHILAFQHPLAGTQLVKGTLELNESIEECAIRELYEESGIENVIQSNYLSSWEANSSKQEWHFVLCSTKKLPNEWKYFTIDGGGLNFEFFWTALKSKLPNTRYKVYNEALDIIRTIL